MRALLVVAHARATDGPALLLLVRCESGVRHEAVASAGYRIARQNHRDVAEPCGISKTLHRPFSGSASASPTVFERVTFTNDRTLPL